MVFPISEILPPISPIRIVDVGAMSLGDGADPYSPLLKAASCHVTGFEPVEAEVEKLQSMSGPDRTYLPHAIGDGTLQYFYETNASMTSSLLEPNRPVLDAFQSLGSMTQVVRRSTIQTRRLDDIEEVGHTDMLKLDIQGAELMALQGAERVLANVVLIHTEVEFVPLYRNQALFSDIDAFLRDRGFLVHRFMSIEGRTFKPMRYKTDIGMMSQMLWADAIFVKDFRNFETLEPESLLKLATILHENYRSLDLAAVALRAYDTRMGTALHDTYIGRFQKSAG